MDNRAVSNTLGYVLLFAVVFASIAAVGTAGVDSLTAVRDGTVSVNAENTMTGIASAVEDVHRENVSRTSRVRLGGGSLAAGETTTITVDVDGSTEIDDLETRPIVYQTGNTRIAYVAGAVFRLEQEGEVTVREPDHRIAADGTVLSLPVTNPSSAGSSVSGSNAEVVLKRSMGTESLAQGSSSVEITIEAPNNRQATLWYTSLEDEFGDNCGGSAPTGSTLTCSQSSPGIVRTTVTEFELAS